MVTSFYSQPQHRGCLSSIHMIHEIKTVHEKQFLHMLQGDDTLASVQSVAKWAPGDRQRCPLYSVLVLCWPIVFCSICAAECSPLGKIDTCLSVQISQGKLCKVLWAHFIKESTMYRWNRKILFYFIIL